MYGLTRRETVDGLLVAACDADIVDETFTDGDTTLHVDPAFYADETVDIGTVADAVERSYTANLVGADLIAALVDRGLVDAGAVQDIGGTRHVQLYRLQ